MKKMILVLLILVISLGLSGCNDENSSFVPKTDLAQDYTIIKEYKYATPAEKKGLEVTIYSKDATTFEKRAQTAIKAALDILKSKNLYEVVIKMSTSKDLKKFNLMAYVEYTPHKKNTWGQNTKHIWLVKASENQIKNGKLIENGKSYPISYITIKTYLEK